MLHLALPAAAGGWSNQHHLIELPSQQILISFSITGPLMAVVLFSAVVLLSGWSWKLDFHHALS